jgi:hypothetical protein
MSAITQALVSRPQSHPADYDTYLFLSAAGEPNWTGDVQAATTFPSMREATRMAMRLPSRFRAYSLPRPTELAVS